MLFRQFHCLFVIFCGYIHSYVFLKYLMYKKMPRFLGINARGHYAWFPTTPDKLIFKLISIHIYNVIMSFSKYILPTYPFLMTMNYPSAGFWGHYLCDRRSLLDGDSSLQTASECPRSFFCFKGQIFGILLDDKSLHWDLMFISLYKITPNSCAIPTLDGSTFASAYSCDVKISFNLTMLGTVCL